VPSYEFVGADPIDHFWAGRVAPGDVVEFTDEPDGPWKPSRKKPTAAVPGDPRDQAATTTEPVSDTTDTESEEA
jgi:hypothetical protein